MSGHSKWSQIHRQKSVADSKRGALFTKLGKAISVAARQSGGDADTNFKLRLAIDQAKAANMPKENIARAVKRGTGELDGGTLEPVTYEGFAPGGAALIIQALTDNRNRTSAALKHILTKHGGSFGEPGSVLWMFEQQGVIHLPALPEATELTLIDQGVSDIRRQKNDETIVYTKPNDLQKIKASLDKTGVLIKEITIDFTPKTNHPLSKKDREQLEKIFIELENNEDVSEVYTNA